MEAVYGFFNLILVGPLKAILTVFYNFTDTMGIASYGLAIVLFTIVLKIILYPLTVKQIKSMKAMQTLQPKMKEIQEKYKYFENGEIKQFNTKNEYSFNRIRKNG